MDFTLADFDMPVLARQYVDRLQELAPDDFQRIPVQVDDLPDPFDIVNVLPSVSCLDTEHSELTYWTEADGHPDRIGEVRMVVTLKIVAERVGNHHLFRIQEWPVPIIISHAARNILKGATGVELTRV
ncbi:imm11 family protein [Longimicrobium sp.]|uniref:imm11 family protein n=1 Tax=Longimicrobium sp. TaxID=2029185 RepID=UPI003B39FC83